MNTVAERKSTYNFVPEEGKVLEAIQQFQLYSPGVSVRIKQDPSSDDAIISCKSDKGIRTFQVQNFFSRLYADDLNDYFYKGAGYHIDYLFRSNP